MFNIIKNMYKTLLLKKEIMYLYENKSYESGAYVSYNRRNYIISKYSVNLYKEEYETLRSSTRLVINIHDKEEYDNNVVIESLINSNYLSDNRNYIEEISVAWGIYDGRTKIVFDNHYNKLYQPIKEKIYYIVHQLYEIKKTEIKNKEKFDIMNIYRILDIPLDKIEK